MSHRDDMNNALDQWIIDNAKQYLGHPGPIRPGESSYRISATTMSNAPGTWLLNVDGEIPDGPDFCGSFRLQQIGNTSDYKVEMVTIENLSELETKLRGSRELSEGRKHVVDRSDVADNKKAEFASQAYSCVQGERSPVIEDTRAFAERVMEWYRAKPGDIVDEMVENFRAPQHTDLLTSLSAVALAIKGQPGVAAEMRGLSLVELLVLRGYTQKPIDIDRDLGWDDAPKPVVKDETPQDKAQREAYENRYTDWMWAETKNGVKCRNGSLFGAVCSASRDQGPGGKQEAWSEAVLRRWIKWYCTLCALCASDGSTAPKTYRGLGGGSLAKEVVENHRRLSPKDVLCWPAPSSTSHEQQTPLEYMLGTAVNSTSKPSPEKPGTIFFQISNCFTGRSLECISQYPAEKEFLIGPMTIFRINAVEDDPNNPIKDEGGKGYGLRVAMTMMGPLGGPLGDNPWLESFFKEVRAEAVKASMKLEKCLERLEETAAKAAAEEAEKEAAKKAESDELNRLKERIRVLEEDLQQAATERDRVGKELLDCQAAVDEEKRRAEEEKRRAEEEKRRAEEEKRRAEEEEDALRQNVAQLKSRLAELQREQDSSGKAANDAARRVAEMEAQLVQERDRLTKERTEVERKFEETLRTVSELQRTKAEDHQAHREREKELERAVAEAKDKGRTAELERVKLESEVNALREALKKKEESLRDRQEQAHTQQKEQTVEIESLQRQLDEDRAKHNEMRRRVHDLEHQLREAGMAYDREKAAVSDMQRSIEQLQEKLREEATVKNKSAAEAKRTKERLDEANTEVEDLKRKIDLHKSSTSATVEELKKKVAAIDSELHETRDRLRKAETDHSREITTLKTKLQRAEAQAGELQMRHTQEVDSIQQQRQLLEHSLEGKMKEISRLKAERDGLVEELKQLKEKANEDSQRIRQLTHDEAARSRELAGATRKHQKELNDAKTELMEARSQLDHLQGDVKRQHMESQQHRQQAAFLQERVADLERQNQKLEAAGRQAAVLQVEKKHLTDALDAEKGQAAQHRSEAARLSNELAELRSVLERKDLDLHLLQSQVATLKEHRTALDTDLKPASPRSFAMDRLEAVSKRLRCGVDRLRSDLDGTRGSDPLSYRSPSPLRDDFKSPMSPSPSHSPRTGFSRFY